MIKSKADYIRYLQADKISLNKPRKYPKFVGDNTWKFQRFLRKLEYNYNVNRQKNLLYKIYYYYLIYKFNKLCLKYGFTIPINVFGPGLHIAHCGSIVVNSHCTVGENCVINVGVNLGMHKGKAPKIGNNVYIGPGAKLFGDITIGDNVSIGANAVVTKSFPDNVTVVGVPAKIIKTKA